MEVDSHQPPLPAPTEEQSPTDQELAEHNFDVATNLSQRTDISSFSIPADGRPITIPTTRLERPSNESLFRGRNRSHTSLLIEYFDANKTEKDNTKPSLRVRVTPSGASDSKQIKQGQEMDISQEYVQQRKPSYTKRISLNGRSQGSERIIVRGQEVISPKPTDGKSTRAPFEVELLSPRRQEQSSQDSRDLRFLDQTSEISSMPPESIFTVPEPKLISKEVKAADKDRSASQTKDGIDAGVPFQQRKSSVTDRARSEDKEVTRSLNRERLTQMVMEKLAANQKEARARTVEYEPDTKPTKERRRRNTRPYNLDEVLSPQASQISSAMSASQVSQRSGTSKISSNPKLLEMVEDAMRRLILPEIQQMRKEQQASRHNRDTTTSRQSSLRERDVYNSEYNDDMLSKSSDRPSIGTRHRSDSYRRERSSRTRQSSLGSSEYKRSRRSTVSSAADYDSKKSSSKQDDDSRTGELYDSRGRLDDVVNARVVAGAAIGAALAVSKSRSRSRKNRSLLNTPVVPPLPFLDAPTASVMTRASIKTEHIGDTEVDFGGQQTAIKEVARHIVSTTPSRRNSSAADGQLVQSERKVIEDPIPTKPTSLSYSREIVPSIALDNNSKDNESSSHSSPQISASNKLTTAFLNSQNTHLDDQHRDSPTTWFKSVSGDQASDFARSTRRGSPSSVARTETVVDSSLGSDLNVHRLGSMPFLVHQSNDVASAVGSLESPSMVNSVQSLPRMVEDTRYKPSPLSRHVTRELNERENVDHVGAIPMQVRSEIAVIEIPEHYADVVPAKRLELRDLQDRKIPSPFTRNQDRVFMGASGVPDLNDPIPEIGHGLDNMSDTSSNPYAGQPPLSPVGGYDLPTAGKIGVERETRHFPLTEQDDGEVSVASGLEMRIRTPPVIKASVTTHNVANQVQRPEIVTATSQQVLSPPNLMIREDEGYVSGAYAPSEGTPKAMKLNHVDHNPVIEDDFMEEDEFMYNAKRASDMSGNSHGMSEELYDNATGRGIDHIQSKDIIALMDHLTVRDAQRNARDTEILVTLVQNAAELRDGLDNVKLFIGEQDRMVMKNYDSIAERTVQKIVNDPKLRSTPQIQSLPAAVTDLPSPNPLQVQEEEVVKKRKSVFRRALSGLGGRDSDDLARIEGMLTQLLHEVEQLKTANRNMSTPNIALTSNPRNHEAANVYVSDRQLYDTAYRQETCAQDPKPTMLIKRKPVQPRSEDLEHTPLSPPNFSPPTKEIFHSGYNGRRDSITRVSTVVEDDEDDLHGENEHVHDIDREEQITPKPYLPRTVAYDNIAGLAGSITPTDQASQQSTSTPRDTPEKQQKHRSTGSSILTTAPKISRWSKTTTSSYLDGRDSRRQSAEARDSFELQYSPIDNDQEEYGEGRERYLSGHSVNYDEHDDADYESIASEHRPRSDMSFDRVPTVASPRSFRSAHSGSTRPASPLIPSTLSVSEEIDYDDHEREVDGQYLSSEHDYQEQGQMTHDDDFDDDEDYQEYELEDPKYQAVRNSLLLQHPQPRQGPTHRHQTHLEYQAAELYHPSIAASSPTSSSLSQLSSTSTETDFDPSQWGSAPAISLARVQKLGGKEAETLLSSSSSSSTKTNRGGSLNKSRDNGPLVPQSSSSTSSSSSTRQQQSSNRPDHNRSFPKSTNGPPRTFDRLYYSSPLGSGHLLEPIEEVRYSLETDSGRMSFPDPSRDGTPHLSIPVAAPGLKGVRKVAALGGSSRRVSGPRPMVK